MKSKVSVTHQIDDLDAASNELIEKSFSDSELGRNSVGILFCYSDMEVDDLVKKVSEKLDFDIIGCTDIANMDEKEGFHDLSATLTVLTGDDISFSTASSNPIDPLNVGDEVSKTYDLVKEKLGETPKLLIAIPPYSLDIMLDAYTKKFNEIAPGVPVLGGLPSYNGTGDNNMTFHNDGAYPDRLVAIGVSGNINPVFSVQNVTKNDADRKRKITKADANTVYEVGDQKFTDYLKDIGLEVEKLTEGNTTVTFVSNPLVIERVNEKGDIDYSFARTLHEINLEDGSGTAIGEIPKGATLSVCSLQRDEIEEAAVIGINDLKEKMGTVAQSGYEFSTIFAVSCIGRHLLMLPNNDVEVKKILSGLPEGVSLSGFYSYGEIGPQGSVQKQNFAHNESLVLCAF